MGIDGKVFVPKNWLLLVGLGCTNWLLIFWIGKPKPPLFIEGVLGKEENPPPPFKLVPKFSPVFNVGKPPPKGLNENCDYIYLDKSPKPTSDKAKYFIL